MCYQKTYCFKMGVTAVVIKTGIIFTKNHEDLDRVVLL